VSDPPAPPPGRSAYARVETPFRGGDPAAPIASGYEVASRDPAHLSEVEREARRVVVRQLLALGVGLDSLPRAMADRGWQMSRGLARAEYEAVMAEWVADHAAFRETTRVAQIRRLEADLVRYRAAETAPDDAPGAKTRWQAVVQTEALLARLQGHLAPVTHEVRVEATVVVREALVEVVAGLTADDLDALVAEELELERLAAEARRDRGALVAHGEPVPDGRP
jgi:hypothetical protein